MKKFNKKTEDLLNLADSCVENMVVAPLRLLHLKVIYGIINGKLPNFTSLYYQKTNPDLWEKIDLLMDHNNDLPSDKLNLWNDLGDQIIDDDNAGDKNEAFTKEELIRCLGILTTNGVNQGVIKGYALYPSFSYLSHR